MVKETRKIWGVRARLSLSAPFWARAHAWLCVSCMLRARVCSVGRCRSADDDYNSPLQT